MRLQGSTQNPCRARVTLLVPAVLDRRDWESGGPTLLRASAGNYNGLTALTKRGGQRGQVGRERQGLSIGTHNDEVSRSLISSGVRRLTRRTLSREANPLTILTLLGPVWAPCLRMTSGSVPCVSLFWRCSLKRPKPSNRAENTTRVLIKVMTAAVFISRRTHRHASQFGPELPAHLQSQDSVDTLGGRQVCPDPFSKAASHVGTCRGPICQPKRRGNTH